jgi:hypothetical protein
MTKTLGIAGLFLVGLAGCGASDEPCAPAGTWVVTASPAPGDDCGEPASTENRVVTVTNGTATITNPADGSTSGQGPLDSSCHLAYVEAISTTDFVAAGQSDWTFNGQSLSGTVSANVTFSDGSKCTLKQKLVGVRQ